MQSPRIMQKNILSVDLEDWGQSTYDLNAPITNYVVENTSKLLDIFSQAKSKATFFCQGLVAEKFPELIKRIHQAGHEIGTHGWSHRSVQELGQKGFKSELYKSVKILEDIIGEKVHGHRAPDFSIDIRSDWPFDIISECGLEYDSSVYPIYGKNYGSPDCPLGPFKLDSGLWEIPLSTYVILGKRRAVLGGGYFRMYPYALSEYFLRGINRQNRPAVIYLHPYEINPAELRGRGIGLKTRIHQGLFRSLIPGRLMKLLADFSFIPIRSYLENE